MDESKAEREAKLERLRADLQKGIDQLDAGEVSMMTMEDIKRLARERAKQDTVSKSKPNHRKNT